MLGRIMGRNRAHESLDFLRGKPISMIELSGARYCSADNPKGWGDPHYTRLQTEGFGCLNNHWRNMASGGYKIAAMWEPSGQYPGSGAMAWTDRYVIQSNWSDIMRLSWPFHVAYLRSIGMEPMWYLGESYRRLSTIVEDLAFVASMGVQVVGLDAFEMLFDTPINIAAAMDAIQRIRDDPRTKNMALVIEGAMKPTITGATRAFFLRHTAQLDLARGGEGKRAILDPNWDKLATAPADRSLIPGSVHIVVMHGSEWELGDIEQCYERARSLGIVPCDYRLPILDWRA